MTDDHQEQLTDGEEENDRMMSEEDPNYDPSEYPKGDKKPLNHGVKLRAKLTRGNGTRDQDTLLIEGRGEDAEEAAADFEEALTETEERGWAQRLRDLQPEEPEAEDDE
jgi:hypothetical protein